MKRREVITLLGAATALWSLSTRAQQPAMLVIGYLSARSPEDTAHLVDAFRRGLREAGFVEGQNVTVEYRWAFGQHDLLPGLAADLVHKSVAVLVSTGGESAALAGKAAASTIPRIHHRRRSGQARARGYLQPARGQRQRDKYHDLHSGTQASRTVARAGAAGLDDRRLFGPELSAL